MKIILANGTELRPILVTGSKRTVQGATRDTLEFVFDGAQGLDALSAAFTSHACETIIIQEDDGVSEYIYSGYTIPVELSRKPVEVSPATDCSGAVFADRITVAVSQRTYAETQLASLTNVVDALVLESLMA